MSPRAAARLAWTLVAVSLLILALGLLLIFLGWSTPLPKGWHPWAYQAIDAVGLVGAPVLGGLIASRRPKNAHGWFWMSFGLGFALVTFAQAYATYGLVVVPGSLPAPRTVGVLAELGGLRWRSSFCLSCCCCSPTAACRRDAGGSWPGASSR